MSAELLVDAKARLGECPLWCEKTGRLYWTDIEGAAISAWTMADGSVRRWALPERLGSFALCEQPSLLLLGLASGVALYDLERETMTPIVRVEAEQPTTRINDGRCDPQGRFVFGMFDAEPGRPPAGGFYRVHADLSVERLPLPPAAVANSLAFSPDGRRLYFADSPTREISWAPYDPDGRIGAPRRFVRLSAAEGFPDGSAVDADAGLWNAQWDGGCVVRYDAHGRETRRVAVPVTRPSCVAFGGAALDRLFITSARIGLSPEKLQSQPQAGGIFHASGAGRGRLEHRFATNLRP